MGNKLDLDPHHASKPENHANDSSRHPKVLQATVAAQNWQ